MVNPRTSPAIAQSGPQPKETANPQPGPREAAPLAPKLAGSRPRTKTCSRRQPAPAQETGARGIDSGSGAGGRSRQPGVPQALNPASAPAG